VNRHAGPVAVMVARGALWNPSIFCRTGEPPPFEEVVRKYTQAAVAANATFQNCKWVLSQVMAGGIGVTTPSAFGGVPMKTFNRQVSGARTMGAICELLGVPHQAADWPAKAHMTTFYRDGAGKASFEAAGGGIEIADAGPSGEGDDEPAAAEPATDGGIDGGAAKRARLAA